MTFGLWGWVLCGVLLTEGILMIAAALLQRAGSKPFRIPRGVKQQPMTFLLLGAAMALGSITSMIPHGESTYVLLGFLYPVEICLGIASLVAWIWEKPVIPDSGHR
jgi:hypothetical protein